MTLNGVMAVTLHYFTEFGKLALQPLTTCTANQMWSTVAHTHASFREFLALSFLVRKFLGTIEIITRNSSGDEIANVNFLYHFVHVLQNMVDSCTNSATDRGSVL